jgi:phospholipid transport system transporter-binding protein
MTSHAEIVENAGCLMVSGSLNFSTVVKIWNTSLDLLAKKTVLTFDLSNVTSANSAGLALLLEWRRYAQNNHQTISFTNMPAQLVSIASVAGVSGILV